MLASAVSHFSMHFVISKYGSLIHLPCRLLIPLQARWWYSSFLLRKWWHDIFLLYLKHFNVVITSNWSTYFIRYPFLLLFFCIDYLFWHTNNCLHWLIAVTLFFACSINDPLLYFSLTADIVSPQSLPKYVIIFSTFDSAMPNSLSTGVKEVRVGGWLIELQGWHGYEVILLYELLRIDESQWIRVIILLKLIILTRQVRIILFERAWLL